MSKIITITDIKIKEFSISKNEEDWTISIVYSLVSAEKEWDSKRIQLSPSELTSGQKTKLQGILTFIINKIKLKEGI